MKLPMLFILFYVYIFTASCQFSQNQTQFNPHLVGSCEGCEGVFEYGDKILKPVDTLPGFQEAKTKIKISGTIYQPDGKTPAGGVVLYIYHTNENGVYPNRGDETGWARRHGYIRGWVKTGMDGQYTFYTLKPGTYPDGTEPAHIHPTILEPDGKYYWIDDYLFEGDALINVAKLEQQEPRGGGSIFLNLTQQGELWVGNRDIILGKNVQGYK